MPDVEVGLQASEHAVWPMYVFVVIVVVVVVEVVVLGVVLVVVVVVVVLVVVLVAVGSMKKEILERSDLSSPIYLTWVSHFILI